MDAVSSPATLAQAVAELVDSAAGGPVLVLGSLPPGGRDLDVLVRPAELGELEEQLAASGLVRKGSRWAAFGSCSAFCVELVPAAWLGLGDAETAALFGEATPVDGFRNLVRPAPHHDLLVLARLGFQEKRRPRLDQALRADPEAWEKAAALAPAWGLEQQLAALRAGRRRRRRLHRPRRTRVVSLSGLDGAGKSTQAAALADALERLGYPARTEWLPLGANTSLAAASAMLRRVLRSLRRLPVFSRLDRRAEEGQSFFAVPGGDHEPRLLGRVWSAYIALANVATHRRRARGGGIVVFDRYVLDSAVRLRYLWGGEQRPQRTLLRVLSPRPVCSFFLEVPPETALERKRDQWSLADLRRQTALYRAEAARLGVHILDGTRPREELCAEIAAEAWARLP